jgi:hypothetical protein
MTVVMILTPPRDDDRLIGRTGDAFDTAFVEILRTLDGQGDKVPVLAPWSPDLAPLVAAALVDTAPSFDPESGGSAAATRSRIIPYAMASEDAGLTDSAAEREATFWRSSHLSLVRETAVPLMAAMNAAPPTHLVVLGLPTAAAEAAAALMDRSVNVFCFGSLVSRGEVAEALGLRLGNVEDLERRLPSEETALEKSSASERERDVEDSLEPYVPYGLLLQDALDEFLPGDELEGGGEAT